MCKEMSRGAGDRTLSYNVYMLMSEFWLCAGLDGGM